MMQYMLYLSDNYATFTKAVYHDHSETLWTINYDDPDHLDTLKAKLSEYAPRSTAIFLDVMGEEIKQEHIPSVSKKDRERIIARKEKSLFHNAEYVFSKQLYRETTGRRDYIYLLIGISLSPTNRKIIDTLVESAIEIHGLYILPLLQENIAELVDDDKLLIVSDNSQQGSEKYVFRKSFFDNGHLSLTRTTAANGTHDSEISYQLDKEIERTNHFLRNSKKIPLDTDTRTLIFTKEKYAEFVIKRQETLRIVGSHVTLPELATSLKLYKPETYTTLPDILCHLAQHQKIKPHLEPASLCKKKSIRFHKRNLVVSAAAVFLLAIAISITFVAKNIGYQSSNAALQHQLSGLQLQKNALRDKAPVTDISPVVMRDAVKLHEAIIINTFQATDVFRQLAAAYEGFEDLSIEGIDWNFGDSNQNDTTGGAIIQSGNFADSIAKPLKLTMLLQPAAELTNREAIKRMTDFQLALLNQPSVQSVEEVRRTIDTRSSEQLEETFVSNRQSSSTKARFFTVTATLESYAHGS